MKKFITYSFVMTLMLAVGIMGCSQPPQSANASEAIENAKAKQSVEEQAQYLIKEANAFVNSQQFDEAIKAAKHVLAKLDTESQEAQGIIEKAKAEIEKLAKEKAEEMKSKAEDMKKDMKDKMGGLGK